MSWAELAGGVLGWAIFALIGYGAASGLALPFVVVFVTTIMLGFVGMVVGVVVAADLVWRRKVRR